MAHIGTRALKQLLTNTELLKALVARPLSMTRKLRGCNMLAKTTKIRNRWFTALPLVLLVGAGALAAAGFQMSPFAGAVSSQSTTVQADIIAELHTSDCADQGPTTLTPGSLQNIGGNCTMTFGSNNNAAGAKLLVANGQATQFLCLGRGVARNCGTNFDDEATGGTLNASVAQLDATHGKSGVQLVSTTGTADWTAATTTYGLPATLSPSQPCHSTSTADVDCVFQFVAYAAANQPAGQYEGVANFTMAAM